MKSLFQNNDDIENFTNSGVALFYTVNLDLICLSQRCTSIKLKGILLFAKEILEEVQNFIRHHWLQSKLKLLSRKWQHINQNINACFWKLNAFAVLHNWNWNYLDQQTRLSTLIHFFRLKSNLECWVHQTKRDWFHHGINTEILLFNTVRIRSTYVSQHEKSSKNCYFDNNCGNQYIDLK